MMGEYTKGIGKKIWCMVKVIINGQMEEVIKETIILIKKKVWVFILGVMVGFTRDSGKEGSNMEMEK